MPTINARCTHCTRLVQMLKWVVINQEKSVMAPIQLDLRKLLGFKIVANEIGSKAQQVAIGAKIGGKPGAKPGAKPKPANKLGTKKMSIDAKVGEKFVKKS